MKFWSININRGSDGSKHLDLQIHGVIDGGWFDEAGVDSKEVISELNKHLDAKTVKARINSIGGSAFAGVAIYNALASHPGEVTCVVEGLAASAASLIAMAGKCVMGPGSMMMIHSPSTVAMGNAEELRKTADVLDKIQDALAGIYTAKTGKSLDEVNDLLDAETWMTADEAVAAGFADAAGSAEEDDSDLAEEDGLQPQMTDTSVIWAGVSFPRDVLPQRVLAMASKTRQTVENPDPVIVTTAALPSTRAPVLAIVPAPEPSPPITRAELELRDPELVKAILAEGHAAGVAAERARLKAIDDLQIKGAVDLVAAAKYGEAPTDASALALAIVKAGQFAGHELLAHRRAESQTIAALPAGAPDKVADPAVALMVAAATARNGGKGK